MKTIGSGDDGRRRYTCKYGDATPLANSQHSLRLLSRVLVRLGLITAYNKFFAQYIFSQNENVSNLILLNMPHSACRSCMYITRLKQSLVRGSIYPPQLLTCAGFRSMFLTYSTSIGVPAEQYFTLVTDHSPLIPKPLTFTSSFIHTRVPYSPLWATRRTPLFFPVLELIPFQLALSTTMVIFPHGAKSVSMLTRTSRAPSIRLSNTSFFS